MEHGFDLEDQGRKKREYGGGMKCDRPFWN
jgi:hypothetical protein